jgi:hypothetical protein
MQFSKALGRLRELASWDGVLDEAAVPFGLEARLADFYPDWSARDGMPNTGTLGWHPERLRSSRIPYRGSLVRVVREPGSPNR